MEGCTRKQATATLVATTVGIGLTALVALVVRKRLFLIAGIGLGVTAAAATIAASATRSKPVVAAPRRVLPIALPPRRPAPEPQRAGSEEWAAQVLQAHWRGNIRDEAELVKLSERPVEPGNQLELAQYVVLDNVEIPDQLSLPHEVAFARTLHVKEALQDRYFLFTHGAALNIGFFHDLISSLDRVDLGAALRPTRAHKRFRVPGTALQFDSVEAFLRYKGAARDNSIRHSVLSCDGYQYSTTASSSALDFFRRDANVLLRGGAAWQARLAAEVANYVTRNRKMRRCLKQEVVSGFTQLANLRLRCGRIYLIAIAKENVRDYVYRSHPGGYICECHQEELEESLERHNRGEMRKCTNGKNPQYRILTHQLDNDRALKVFSFDTMTEEQRGRYLAILQPLQSLLKTCMSLESLDAKMSGEEIESILLRVDPQGPYGPLLQAKRAIIEPVLGRLPERHRHFRGL